VLHPVAPLLLLVVLVLLLQLSLVEERCLCTTPEWIHAAKQRSAPSSPAVAAPEAAVL
jgi:hypothetical protein